MKPAAVRKVSGLHNNMPAAAIISDPARVAVQNRAENSSALAPPLFRSTAYPGINTALRPPSPIVRRKRFIILNAA